MRLLFSGIWIDFFCRCVIFYTEIVWCLFIHIHLLWLLKDSFLTFLFSGDGCYFCHKLSWFPCFAAFIVNVLTMYRYCFFRFIVCLYPLTLTWAKKAVKFFSVLRGLIQFHHSVYPLCKNLKLLLYDSTKSLFFSDWWFFLDLPDLNWFYWFSFYFIASSIFAFPLLQESWKMLNMIAFYLLFILIEKGFYLCFYSPP